MKRYGKILSKAVSLICVGVLSAGILVGCGDNGGKKNTAENVTFESALDSSLISGIGVLNSYSTANPVLSSTKGNVIMLSQSELLNSDIPLSEEERDEIIQNLMIAQNTLNGDVIKSEVKPSDREGYEFCYTLSATDISGERKTYEFHYNEKTLPGDTDDDDDDFFEGKEDNRSMTGIAVMDGTEYSFVGKSEREGNESEYTFIISVDKNNYVKVEHESENRETEFSYTTYKDGRKVIESSVEYEVNKNGKIELSFESEIDGREVEYSYKFFKNKDESFVKVEIENDTREQKIFIKVIQNADLTYSYEFVSYSESVDFD